MPGQAELGILITLKDSASPGMQKMNEGLKAAKEEADKTKLAWEALGKAAMGLSAVGAAGLALIQSNKDMNISLQQTGITMGMTRDEMVNLATATANAGFPLAEVASTFDVLAKAGITSADQMQATANAFDALADATGGEADVLASTLIPAFKNLGVEIPQTAEGFDALTNLANTTSVTLDDFGSVMNYVAANGSGLGVTMDSIIASLGALEAKGISGTAATKKYRTAITEAATSQENYQKALKATGLTQEEYEAGVAKAKAELVTLNQALGLTDAEIAKYKTEMDGAAGATEDYASAADENITLVDKLKNGFGEAALKLSGFLEPFQPLMAAMTALVPIIMAVKAAKEAWTIAQIALNVAMDANPIGLIILAIGALIAIVALIIANWDKIGPYFKALWEGIKAIFETVINWIKNLIINTWNTAVENVKTIWNGLKTFFSAFWNAIKAIFNGIVDFIKQWGLLFCGPVGVIIKFWDQIKAFFQTLWNGIKNVFQTAIQAINAFITDSWNRLKSITETVWNAIRGFLEGQWNMMRTGVTTIWNGIKSAFQSVWDGIKGVFTNAWNNIRAIWDGALAFFQSIPGRVSSAFSSCYNAVVAPFQNAYNTVKSLLDTLFGWIGEIPGRVTSAISSVSDVISNAWDAVTPWATGGVINRPTLMVDAQTGMPYAIAGEAGPEAVVPMGAMSGRGGGGGGGITYVVNISAGAFVGDRAGADQFANFILDSLRTKQRYSYGAAQF